MSRNIEAGGMGLALLIALAAVGGWWWIAARRTCQPVSRSGQRGFVAGPGIQCSGSKKDPYFSSTKLLLKFIGPNNSVAITDSSPAANAITVSGNAKISTAQQLFGESVGYFDGTTNTKISTAADADFDHRGDFTWDGWVRFGNVESYPELFSVDGNYGTHGGHGVGVTGAGGKIAATVRSAASPAGPAASDIRSTTSPVNGVWYWVEWNKKGDVYRLFVDGRLEAQQTSATAVAAPAGRLVTIGGYYDNTERLNGFLKDLRFTKGIARHVSDYTRPRAPASNE